MYLPTSMSGQHNIIIANTIIKRKSGEEEAQTKDENKKRAVSPSTAHNWLYIFLFF